MEENKSVLVGMDLANDYTQLCCYNDAGELYSVSFADEQGKYRIPTVLCAREGVRDWLFGEDAMYEQGDCVRIDGLVELAERDGSVMVYDKNFPADILLERYFKRLLAALDERLGGLSVRGICICVKTLNPTLKRNIYSAMELLGYREDRLKIITRLESFMYYTVSQNPDIWINDVGLFDFDRQSFCFYKLSFGRKQQPLTIVAECTNLSKTITYGMLSDTDMDQMKLIFDNTVSMMLHRQVVSALYFTGCGFESSWADESLKSLCSGRRVFRGQNLYVKGAGYAASLLFDDGGTRYLLVGNDVLKSSVSIRVFHDAQFEEIPLAAIGQRYTEAGATLEVIMDDTNELDFIIHNALKKDFICAIMTLDTLVLRPDRTVRLEVNLKFPDRDTCVITVRDRGFGKIYDTNYRIWEQVIKI